MEKKILILASNSFIAKNIIKYFSNKKYLLVCLNRNDIDFKDENLLKDKIKEINPEVVINCCAVVGSSFKNNKINNFDILNENILLNKNILNSCSDDNIKQIIMFSSYRVFGDNIHENYDENDIQKNEILTNIGYLSSKKILDLQIKLFVEKTKKNVICLILTNIFGDYDDFTINSRIIPSLIMKSMISRNENNDIIIDSNKDVLINLVYVNDISKIIERCIHNTDIQGNLLVFNKNGIYNLEKIINIINNYIENKNKIIFNNENLKKTNIMKPKLNKFEKYFCDFEFTEIEKSLKTTIDNINQ